MIPYQSIIESYAIRHSQDATDPTRFLRYCKLRYDYQAELGYCGIR